MRVTVDSDITQEQVEIRDWPAENTAVQTSPDGSCLRKVCRYDTCFYSF